MKKFNLIVIKVESGGDEESIPWIAEPLVMSQIRRMKPGDQLIIERVEDSDEI